MNKKIIGVNGTSAQVILASKYECGPRVVTMVLEFPRIILAELEKHRMMSISCASSRAIPWEKMQAQLTGIPTRFGSAKAGMQDGGEHNALVALDIYVEQSNGSYLKEKKYFTPEQAWEIGCERAKEVSQAYFDANYAKQVANRPCDTYQQVIAIVTATEWANFFWLRDHNAADPSICELARVAREAYKTCNVQTLYPDEWHLPFVDVANTSFLGNQVFCHKEETGIEQEKVEHILSLEDAVKVSCARAAAISYRNEKYSPERCLSVYDKLVGGDRIHGGALEHACKVPKERIISGEGAQEILVNIPCYPESWEPGITHMTRDYNLWGGNFKGYIQHRGLIEGQAGPQEVI